MYFLVAKMIEITKEITNQEYFHVKNVFIIVIFFELNINLMSLQNYNNNLSNAPLSVVKIIDIEKNKNLIYSNL